MSDWERLKFFQTDRKSTRLNSSHPSISYAVFCLKKKKYKLILSSHYILFSFNDTATTEIYTLSLHDALPIWGEGKRQICRRPYIFRQDFPLFSLYLEFALDWDILVLIAT